MNEPNSTNLTGNGSACEDAYAGPYLEIQFYLIVYGGFSIAIFSFCENSLLLYTFLSRPRYIRSAYFYMTILAIFDLLHSVSYSMIMVGRTYLDYTEDLAFMDLWYWYCLPMFSVSHVVLCTSSYLLVAASLEKYFTAHHFNFSCSVCGRLVSVTVAFLFSLISKGSIFFEYRVVYQPHCEGLNTYVLAPTHLLHNKLYERIWCFWYRHIVTTFLPFTILVYTNTMITKHDRADATKAIPIRGVVVRKFVRYQRKLSHGADSTAALRIQQKPTDMAVIAVSSDRANLIAMQTYKWAKRARKRLRRASTRTLIIIVLEYLICSGLSVIITAWEVFDLESLYNHYDFYTFGSDAVSLLTVVSCAIRLPTYCATDARLRHDVKEVLTSFFCCLCSFKICAQRKAKKPLLSFNLKLKPATASSTSKERVVTPKIRQQYNLSPKNNGVSRNDWSSKLCYNEWIGDIKDEAYNKEPMEIRLHKAYRHIVSQANGNLLV